MTAIKPIGKIKVIGRRGTEEPFPIPMQKGLCFYIQENQAKRLEKEINDALLKKKPRKKKRK